MAAGIPLKTAARCLTGVRGWTPTLLGCGNLRYLSDALRMRADDLLWNHTVFPYATAYFADGTYRKAVHNVLAGGASSVGFAAVLQSVSDYVPMRRTCPSCAAEDQATWGITYWKRMHHLPGVLFCPIHMTRLRQAALPSAKQCSDTTAPTQRTGRVQVKTPPTDFDQELARLSLLALNRSPGAPCVLHRDHYRQLLQMRGFLGPSGQVNRQDLAAWGLLNLRRPPELLGLSGGNASMVWLARMLSLKDAHPHGTFKHLVFASLVEVSSRSGVTWGLSDSGHGPSAKPKEAADTQLAKTVRAIVQGFIRAGERARVSDVLTAAGCWSAFRHQPAQFPRLAAEVARLKSSAAAMRPNWGKGAARTPGCNVPSR